MIATVIGSTGLTGSSLTRQLLADPAITKVISVSRRRLDIPSAKLAEVIVPDLTQIRSIAPEIRGNLYFCCLGTTIRTAGSKAKFEQVDHDAIVAFAEVAKAHDARSFTLVSAMGANARSMFFYNQVKGRTENDVIALGLGSTIIFRPALLAGPRREFRLAERVATRILVPLSRLLPAAARKRLVTDAETLAARMLVEGKAAPIGVRIIEAKDI
jgi:uncharacterized protein YbjT (DUF2867 family)